MTKLTSKEIRDKLEYLRIEAVTKPDSQHKILANNFSEKLWVSMDEYKIDKNTHEELQKKYAELLKEFIQLKKVNAKENAHLLINDV